MYSFLLGPLHGFFMLLTILGVLLLMYWIFKYTKKETQLKVATWFLIFGIVGCAATLVGMHMLWKDQDGNIFKFRMHGDGISRDMMFDKKVQILDAEEDKSVKLAPANTNVSLAPANQNTNLFPLNANQNN